MSDGALLLEAIRRRPDDDLVRLVYADWLDENGDLARAEFIRVQIEAERQPGWSAEYATAKARAIDLLQAHHPRWTEGYGEVLARGANMRVSAGPCSGAPGVWFSRGFVEEVCIRPELLFSLDESAVQPQGPLPTLRLSFHHHEDERYWALESFLDALAAAPVLGLFRDVHLYGGFSGTTDEGLLRLAAKPDLLARLGGLSLSEDHVSDRGLLPILESPSLVQLRKLVVDCTGVTEAVLGPLTRSPRFREMTVLRLDGCVQGAKGFRLFATPGRWPRLRELHLNSCGLDGLTLKAFHRPGAFPALESLGLCFNEVYYSSVRDLLASGAFPRLRHLGLGATPLTFPEVEELRSQFGDRVEIYFPVPRQQQVTEQL